MKKLLLAGAFAALFSGAASAAVDNIVLVQAPMPMAPAGMK